MENVDKDDSDQRGMTQRLEDILQESSGERASRRTIFSERHVTTEYLGPRHNTEGGPVFVSMVIAGPLVAGRTKDFVQRILAASAGGQTQHKERDEAVG